MKYSIFLWGIGERSQYFMQKKYFEKCEIAGFIDTYKNQEYFLGYKVYSPEELMKEIVRVDYIIITNQYFSEILGLCEEIGIPWEKILITAYISEPVFKKKMKKIREISEDLFLWMSDRKLKIIKINESDNRDALRLLGQGKYDQPIYMEDYFRYRTFEFVAKEIIENHVDGAIAELGVFRGVFSSLINETFNNRKLYLFDTFEGFQEEEAMNEINMGRCDLDFISEHKDSSVERLLNNLPYAEKCIICKGYFPESIPDEAVSEKYAFVSIDVDFEESTYQGLKFFYPRLSVGGMIFVHDYNTFFLDGIKLAVSRFERESGIFLKKVPLADRAGTLVIIK